MREAVVLAGGFGTRLAHIVSDVPKPMAQVCERPFLRYVLDDLQAKGVERVVLAVGYKAEIISSYFGEHYRGMQLIYSIEDKPLLTGGAIKNALTQCTSDRVLVLNGDTYFDVPFDDLYAIDSDVVMALKRMREFSRYGTVELNGVRLCGFREKASCVEGLINGGVYLVKRDLLVDAPERFSFESDFLETKLSDISVCGIEVNGYFIDIGVPQDYAIAQETLKPLARKNKAAFFDRDGTINEDVHYLYRPEDLRFIDGMPQFIRKWNDWGYKVIVVTNQAGIARGYYTEAEMRSLHRYMNDQLAEYGAHIDAFYFCPHHPDFTGQCQCRKPRPGMIEDAIREFDLDPTQCILFGDKPWDVEAGERCRISSYLTSDTWGISR